MTSSDSEDDCYTNVAQKLQNMKNKFQDGTCHKEVKGNIINDSIENNCDINTTDIVESPVNNLETSTSNTEELENEAFIEKLLSIKKPKGCVTRSAARRNLLASNDSLETILYSSSTDFSSCNENESISRGRGKGRRNGQNISSRNSISPRRKSRRGTSNRGRNNKRGSSRKSTSPRCRACRGTSNRSGGRGQGRTRPTEALISSLPIYSIGNTEEYPDMSDNQTLFSKPSEIIEISDEMDQLDENEELSVKVYWQNLEYFKFMIRKYQKLTRIFDFFAERENVSHDKLLFTFKDKILKADDTPDSINYNIAKFIDGGVINHSVPQLRINIEDDFRDGIKIKFQCQNVKKPYVTVIQLDERILVAMMKCAEQLEKPLHKLKFEFDGDSISGQSTPRDLELEGGETIDVKILS